MKRIFFTIIALCAIVSVSMADPWDDIDAWYEYYNQHSWDPTYEPDTFPGPLPIYINGICYSRYTGPSTMEGDDMWMRVMPHANGGKYSENVTIPAYVTYEGYTYPVKEICDSCFVANPSYIQSVSIPGTIEMIGRGAFFNNQYLTTVNIADRAAENTKGLTIRDGVFHSCENLKNVTLPNDIVSIGRDVFEGCYALPMDQYYLIYAGNYLVGVDREHKDETLYTIKRGTVYIGESALDGCQKARTIGLPDGILDIHKNAFRDCKSLDRITIPDGVRWIDDKAFESATSLAKVNIPLSVQTMGKEVFRHCEELPKEYGIYYADSYLAGIVSESGMEECVIRRGTRFIDPVVFEHCSQLTSIVWNTNDYTLPANADADAPFQYVRNQITKFEIGNHVTYAPAYMTQNMQALTEITFGERLTSTDEKLLYMTTSLATVHWNALSCAKPKWYLPRTITQFTFGDQVQVIPNGLCEGMNGLTEVTIPESVTEIGARAFYGTGIKQIEIPENVRVVGTNVFANSQIEKIVWKAKNSRYPDKPDDGIALFGSENSKVNSIQIGEGVTNILPYMCYNMPLLTSISLPSTTERIGANAFGMPHTYEKHKLQELRCYALVPPIVETNAIHQLNCPIYVPAGSVAIYKAADGWSEKADLIQGIQEVIDHGCLYEIDHENESAKLIRVMDRAKNVFIPSTVYCLKGVNDKWYKVQDIDANAFAEESIQSIQFEHASQYLLVSKEVFEAALANAPAGIPVIVACGQVEKFKQAWGDHFFIERGSDYTVNLEVNIPEGGNIQTLLPLSCSNDQLRIQAIPTDAYSQFVDWEDGTTDATRTVDITQDTTLTANFELQKSGKWNGINWQWADGTLSLTGSGVLMIPDENVVPWHMLANYTQTLLLPQQISAMSVHPFAGYSSLTSIVCEATTPPSITTEVFADVDKSIPVYVPIHKIQDYKAAAGWEEFTNIQPITHGKCGDDLTWEYNDGVLTISGTGAMYDYYNNMYSAPWLVYAEQTHTLVLPKELTTLPEHSWDGMKMTTIYWNVRALEMDMIKATEPIFGDAAPYVTKLILGNEVETIPSMLCRDMSELTSLTIPTSVTLIGSVEFDGCTKLTHVYVMATTPPILYPQKYYDHSQITCYVPLESLVAYRNHTTWSDFNLMVQPYQKDGLWYQVDVDNQTATLIANPNGNKYSGELRIPAEIEVTNSADETIFSYSVNAFDSKVFLGCDGMITALHMESEVPPVISTGTLTPLRLGCTIYLPCGAGDAYRAATGWSDMSHIFSEPAPQYTISITSSDPSLGGITYITPYTCASEECVVEAVPQHPNEYMFDHWSDGNTENPRTLTITGNLSLTAYWAVSTHGPCGDDLTWNYADSVLTIEGTGEMYDYYTSHSAPWDRYATEIYAVSLPAGLTKIRYHWDGCTNLRRVEWNVREYVIASTGASPLYDVRTQIKEFVLGETVEVVPKWLCYGMSNLHEFMVPSGVTSYDRNALDQSGVKTIYWNSNAPCTQLILFDNTAIETVVVGEGVTTIPNNFCYSNVPQMGLQTVILPSTLTSIGNYAFVNTQRLSTVICYSKNCLTLGYDVFTCRMLSKQVSMTVYVPHTSVSDYRNSGWNGSGDIQPIPVEVDGVWYAMDDTKTDKTAAIAAPWYSEAYEGNIAIPAIVEDEDNEYAITSVKSDAFAGATGVTGIVSEVAVVPSCANDNTFQDVDANITVLVPTGAAAKYKAATGWRHFNNIVEPTPTDISGAAEADTNSPTKVLRDGQLLILRDGKAYTTMGKLIK